MRISAIETNPNSPNNNIRKEPSSLALAGALGALYIIWGSTYLAIRFAVETVPPFLSIGTRFIIGGSIIYAWQAARGVQRPSLAQWKTATVIGGLMLLGGTGLVAWAEQTVESGQTALIVAAVPLWISGMGWVVNRDHLSLREIAGLLLGFLGVALLIGPRHIAGAERADLAGSIVLVVASILWAAGSIYSKNREQHPAPIFASGMSMIAGGVLLIGTSALAGELGGFHLSEVSLKSGLSILFLATFGSIAFSAFLWLMQVTTPARASSYAYVNPVVAVLLGWMLADETITGRTVLAAAIILSAVWMIVAAGKRPKSV